MPGCLGALRVKRIDVALVGCGHMGRHHARIVSTHPDCRLVATVDARRSRALALGSEWGAEAREDVPDAVGVVIIATPTTTHVDIAEQHVREGRWCLVEKPVAPTASDAERLRGPRTWAGHSERHNPAWRGERPAGWRHLEVSRVGPPTGRCRDVDAILDLMSHDLDLLRWAGRRVESVRIDHAHYGDDGILDQVVAHLGWTDGATASISASRRAGRVERAWRTYDRGQYRHVDLGAPASPGKDSLTRQWATFVDAVRERRALPWTFDAAVQTVADCERVQDAARRAARG